MSTGSLKDNIDGFRVPKFKLSYIRDTTHTSHKNLVKFCHELYYMWWVNQYLELQEWEDCIKPNKKIILDIVMLVPNKNQQGCKEHVI